MNEAQPENPRDENARANMQKIGHLVDEEIPTGWGFVVMAFPLGDQAGRLNYVSNGKREDVEVMLKRFLKRARKQKDWGRHV
jgi:hypothetical protein